MYIKNKLFKNLWPLTNIRELWTCRCRNLRVWKWKLTCFNLAWNIFCPQLIGSAALGCEFRRCSHRDHAENTSVRPLVLHLRHKDRLPSLYMFCHGIFSLHYINLEYFNSRLHIRIYSRSLLNHLIFATYLSNNIPHSLYNHAQPIFQITSKRSLWLCDCSWSELEWYKDTRWSERVQVMVGNG